MIKKVWLRNFKSFGGAEIVLRTLNVVVGANASGKSNFVQALRFLCDLVSGGALDLERTIQRYGGLQRLINYQSDDRTLTVGFHWEVPERRRIDLSSTAQQQDAQESPISVAVDELRYEITLQLGENGQTLIVLNEEAELHLRYTLHDAGSRRYEQAGRVELKRTTRDVGKAVAFTIQKVHPPDLEPLFIYLPDKSTMQSDSLESIPLILRFIQLMGTPMPKIRFYDLNPQLAKRATVLSDDIRLSEDGHNLPAVLEALLRDEEKRKTLNLLVSAVIPHLEEIRVAPSATGANSIVAVEKFAEEQVIPANQLSDGAIELLALLIVLYFESSDTDLIVFEDPGKHFHPKMMSTLMYIVRDSLGQTWFKPPPPPRQVLITTQNSELVRYAELDELLLVERDRKGFSVVKRPADSKGVKKFLSNNLGIAELHAHDLLGR